MDKTDLYRGLRFDRQLSTVPRRLIPVGIALVLFTLLWLVIPPVALFWLLLLGLVVLVWMASYGWRQAVAALIALLRRLEQG